MLSCPSAASLASETNIIRCLGRFSNMTPNLGGYVVNLDKRQLEGVPAYDVRTEPAWGDRSYESKRIHDYYGVGPYWTM